MTAITNFCVSSVGVKLIEQIPHLCTIMSESITISGTTRKEKYESLIPQIKTLVQGESDFIANISNSVGAIKHAMNFFWVGIYFVKGNDLVLGPFQGPVACTRIAFGKGVCGTSWKEKKTMMVNDVQIFPGHIVCSSDSKSEIVVPCFKNARPDRSIGEEVFAVLDIDSDKLNDFDETDKFYLEQIAEIINECANVQI